MRTIRKTFVTLFVTVFAIAFALLFTVLIAAACSEKVTLRFETGGGTYLASVEGRSGSTYEKPQDPEKEGYFFDGWYLDASCAGESTPLPEVLPEQSATYFAKYVRSPLLSLDLDGGTLAQSEHRVRPGTPLNAYLSAHVPQKEGLIFGGWEKDGVLLGEDAVMTEEDLSLKARYKANFEVAVYLQAADDPEQYEKSEEYSFTGSDWENAAFKAQVPGVAHFRYDEQNSLPEGVLHAGENLFTVRYTREELTVRYRAALPEGEWEEETLSSRYGAHVELKTPPAVEGYTFFGWAGGGEEYAAGAPLTLTVPLDLLGTWGKNYPNLRGEGVLAVETGEEEVRRAVYEKDGERAEGKYRREDGTFEAGGYRGRVERGGHLLDDTGEYMGGSLAENAAGKQYGTLVLDFFEKSAVLRQGERELRGSYVYDYDEESERYTGDYLFSGSGENLRFKLFGEVFLLRGEEKGSYRGYDLAAGEFFGDVLTLDGYGGAALERNGDLLAGSYRGGRRESEWQFSPSDGDPFYLLTGAKIYGGNVAAESAFLYHDAEKDGVYSNGEDLLTLDGYGLGAVYQRGEERIEGSFKREGNLVTIGENTRLTLLPGGAFRPTGEEYGSYAGEKGVLLLDGAGGAVLARENAARTSGSYAAAGEDWLFEGDEGFKFRLAGEEYLVFDEMLYGQFENPLYGLALDLDGYGGGRYYPPYKDVELSVTVLYGGDDLFIIRSEQIKGTGTLALKADRENRTVTEVLSATAGAFPVCEGGQPTAQTLILDGVGGAILREKSEKRGTYRVLAQTDEIECTFGEEKMQFRLFELETVPYCLRSAAKGVYKGKEGTLVLDGYCGAVYRTEEGEELSAQYSAEGGNAEIMRGDELYQFVLSEGAFVLKRFDRYFGPEGREELYLQKNGVCGLLRGEENYVGSYDSGHFICEAKSFYFRVIGQNYYFYDLSQARALYGEEGETLILDGCGFATYSCGEERYTGKAYAAEDGLVWFSAPGLNVLSGQIGFLVAPTGRMERLGEEFGLYRSIDGKNELFLRGDGVAYYRASGAWRAGEYAAETSFYRVSFGGAEFAFRVRNGEQGPVYEKFEETLLRYEGNYPTSSGELAVDGFSVTFGGRAFRFVCGGEGAFVAEDVASGEYFVFRLGEQVTVSPARGRFEAGGKIFTKT